MDFGAGSSGPAPIGTDPRRYAQYLASLNFERDRIYAELVSRFPITDTGGGVGSVQWFGRLASSAYDYGTTLREAYTFPDPTVIRGPTGIPAAPGRTPGYRYGVNVELRDASGNRIGRYVEIKSSAPLSVEDIRDMSAAAVDATYRGGRTGSSWSARRAPTPTGSFTVLFVDRP